MTIVLEPGLYHLPLNLAWVPDDSNEKGNKRFFAFGNDMPLACCCDLSFSLNLTAHFLEGRRDYVNSAKSGDDELFVLHHCNKAKDGFNDSAGFGRLENIAQKWGECGKLIKNATHDDISNCLANRAEFLMFACHGASLESGPILRFNGCNMVSDNLAYSVALHGNRLLLLGACDSATPTIDTYGKFIGAFVAAGAGAILANPCQAPIETVCNVAADTLAAISDSRSTVNVAEQLRAGATNCIEKYQGIFGDDDSKIFASTYQLWL